VGKECTRGKGVDFGLRKFFNESEHGMKSGTRRYQTGMVENKIAPNILEKLIDSLLDGFVSRRLRNDELSKRDENK
jgi:hypothetical protein